LILRHAAPAFAASMRAVVKMDVGDQGEAGLPGDRLEGGRRVLVGTGHAHDVGPGLLELADLFQGRGGITGDRVVIDCTVIGASPPTGTLPTWIWRHCRRSMERHGRRRV